MWADHFYNYRNVRLSIVLGVGLCLSLVLIIHMWIRRKGRLFWKLFWTLILFVPYIGPLIYWELYNECKSIGYQGAAISKSKRFFQLEKTKSWARLIHIVGWLLLIWAFFYPSLYEWPYPYELLHTYKILIWAAILLPPLSACFSRSFSRVLKLNSDDNEVSHEIVLGFMLSSSALAFRAFCDWNILDWKPFWLPFALFSVGLLLLLYWCGFFNTRLKIISLTAFLLISSAYGYGTTISLNGILDKSIPCTYKALVAEKHKSFGKYGESYRLRLSWQQQRSFEEDLYVGKMSYERHKTGDSVDLFVRPGGLRIQWFYVR